VPEGNGWQLACRMSAQLAGVPEVSWSEYWDM
jgi:hypothetical protein